MLLQTWGKEWPFPSLPPPPPLSYAVLELYNFLHNLVLLSCHITRSVKWTRGESMDMRCLLTGRGRERELNSGCPWLLLGISCWSSAAGCPSISIGGATSTTSCRPLGWGFPDLRLQRCLHDPDLSNQMTVLPFPRKSLVQKLHVTP